MGKRDKNYDISVIIPIYNAEKYIEKCIRSVMEQTKDNIEIVAVNDGCTDRTPEILDELANECEDIVIVKKENGGLASARIAGLENASGKYVGWIDADDFAAPEMYEKLYELAQKTKSDYVYCDYSFYPQKVPTKEKWFKEYHGKRDWRFIDRNTQCWNTLTLRDLLVRINLCDTYRKFEEYSWISVMLNAKKISYTNEELYYYRVGNETMSGGTYAGKMAHFEKGASISAGLMDMIKNTKYEKKLAKYFEYRYIYTLLQVEIVAAVNRNKEAYLKARKELKRLQFKKNPLTKIILDNNHGKVKSFVIRNVIPLSYMTACQVTDRAF